MHKVVLMEDRIRELKGANAALSKRRRAKEKRIRAGGPLRIRDATNILADRDVQTQLEEEMRSGSNCARGQTVALRHCSKCSEAGHNSCTCQKDMELDGELNPE